MPAKFQRSVFHSFNLDISFCIPLDECEDLSYLPVVARSSIKEQDSGSTLNEPSSVNQLDASFPHSLDRLGKWRSGLTVIFKLL